jgi:hypothetical protein
MQCRNILIHIGPTPAAQAIEMTHRGFRDDGRPPRWRLSAFLEVAMSSVSIASSLCSDSRALVRQWFDGALRARKLNFWIAAPVRITGERAP